MSLAVTQTFIPGPRLIDGSDLTTMIGQINNAFGAVGLQQQVSNTSIATAGAGVLTAAAITSGLITRTGPVAAFTDTTDTAVAIVAAITGVVVGQSFYMILRNTTAFTDTLAAASGVTLAGITVLPPNTTLVMLVKLTSLTAVAMTGVQIDDNFGLPYAMYTAGNNTINATMGLTGLTGAQLCTLTIGANNRGGIALPPATQITGATPNAAAGLNYTLTLRNAQTTVGQSVQLTGLTGTQIVGTANLDAATARTFNVSFDSLNSVTLTGLTSTTL